jgi:hypothetical protein
MRVICLALAGMLAICLLDLQAFAAGGNPDRTYYRGAVFCGGAAYCSYRANKVKSHKRHLSPAFGFPSYALQGARPSNANAHESFSKWEAGYVWDGAGQTWAQSRR